jgi:hypothetical protein
MYVNRAGNTDGDRTYKYVDVFQPDSWQIAPLNSKAPILLLTGSAGGGKAFWTETEIPTPDGWVKIGDIAVGDFVLGSDGTPAKVVATTDVMYDGR